VVHVDACNTIPCLQVGQHLFRFSLFTFVAIPCSIIAILMNLLGPSRGRASIFGVDSRALSPREPADIGYVSENQDLPRRLTVAEFLGYLGPFS
jgi:hypothetical protein